MGIKKGSLQKELKDTGHVFPISHTQWWVLFLITFRGAGKTKNEKKCNGTITKKVNISVNTLLFLWQYAVSTVLEYTFLHVNGWNSNLRSLLRSLDILVGKMDKNTWFNYMLWTRDSFEIKRCKEVESEWMKQ